MANHRRVLKPLNGFQIVVVNGWKYTAYDGETYLESNDLNSLKKKIKAIAK